MLKFQYLALNQSGQEVKGQIEAASLNEALNKIRQNGLFPVDLSQRGEKKVAGSFLFNVLSQTNLFKRRTKRLSQQDLVIFTRQTSVLLDAGFPLVRCLNTIKKQSRFETMRNMIESIVGIIESGGTFSDALAHYPSCFSKVYVNIVKAGETGGALDVVLKRLADFLERNLRLTQRIRAAFIYPTLVLFIAIGILGFIVTFVIPRFTELFKDMNIDLPFLTVLLLRISYFLRLRWYVFLLFIAFLIISYRLLLRNYRFRFFKDKIKLKAPVLGEIFQKINAARFARTLSTLIGGGVPILHALELTKEVVGNEVITKIIGSVYDSVREGGFIAKVLENNEIFPQLMVNMVAVGEESGSLDKMLAKVADTFEEEVELTTSTLTSLLEPALIILLGIIVGFIVISMFLPLLTLIQTLSE